MTGDGNLRVGLAGMSSDHVWAMGDGLAAAPGVHVYSDKPMAATLAGAERIGQAVARAGITYMCAYHSAFNPVYDQVRALLQGGAIGRIYLARGVTGHGGPREFGCSEYFCE